MQCTDSRGWYWILFQDFTVKKIQTVKSSLSSLYIKVKVLKFYTVLKVQFC